MIGAAVTRVGRPEVMDRGRECETGRGEPNVHWWKCKCRVVLRHLPKKNKLNVMSCRDICLKNLNIRHRHLPESIKTCIPSPMYFTILKVVRRDIRFPHRPSLAFTRNRPFPSQTRRLAIAFWRLPREPASTHTLSHIVRAARQCASHTRAQHVRGRSGRAADALHLLCLQCANWRFSQHCGCVVPGCSSDSRRRPRVL